MDEISSSIYPASAAAAAAAAAAVWMPVADIRQAV